MTRVDLVLSNPETRAVKVECAWCGLRLSAGKYQGTECCKECRDGGRVFRVQQSMGRWKRIRDKKEAP